MDSCCLRTPKERPEILRILERIEDEHERRLVDACEPARLDDDRHALVTVESGDGRERPAFDFDDGDAQPGCVQDELLECVATVRHDEEAVGRATRSEDLLDRATAGDQYRSACAGQAPNRSTRP